MGGAKIRQELEDARHKHNTTLEHFRTSGE